jgi:nucleoside-diphosphate-sugar epimerase
MTKMLVIGAAGFTGSSLVNYLIQNTQYNVVGVDNLENKGFVQNLAPAIQARSRFSLHICDIMNAKALSKILKLEQPDSILYLAVSEKDSFEKELDKLSTVLGCFLESSANHIFIFGKDKYANNEKIFHLQSFVHELSNEIVDFNKNVTFVESCKVFGPKQSAKEDIAKIMLNTTSNISIDLLCKRYEFLYVKEFFQRFLSIYEGNPLYGTYDISSGIETTLEQIDTFVRLYEKSQEQTRIYVQYNPITLLESRNIRQIPVSFGYPPLRLEEYLIHTYQWYKDNKDIYIL